MLKSRIGNIIIFILLILVVLTFIFNLSFTYRWILYLTFFSLLIYGSFKINSSFYIKTFCKKITSKKEISLTFDDGPHSLNTKRILDILDKYNIKAAFFLIGKNVVEKPEIVQDIALKGHLIGNHSYNHKWNFGFLSSNKIKEELEKTEKVILKTTGIKTKMFRPPFAVTNPNIGKAVSEMNYKCIGWSLRSFDTRTKDKDKLLSKLKRKLKSGDIILFHDYPISTVNVLEDFINFALESGYNFLRLDEFLGINVYENQN